MQKDTAMVHKVGGSEFALNQPIGNGEPRRLRFLSLDESRRLACDLRRVLGDRGDGDALAWLTGDSWTGFNGEWKAIQRLRNSAAHSGPVGRDLAAEMLRTYKVLSGDRHLIRSLIELKTSLKSLSESDDCKS